MEITKIEFGESCFGGIARVNDINIINDTDNNSSEIESQALQNEVLTLLFNTKHNLSISDWSLILDMIVQNYKNDSNNYVFGIDEQDSHSDSCEQCGNYNHLNVYNKI